MHQTLRQNYETTRLQHQPDTSIAWLKPIRFASTLVRQLSSIAFTMDELCDKARFTYATAAKQITGISKEADTIQSVETDISAALPIRNIGPSASSIYSYFSSPLPIILFFCL